MDIVGESLNTNSMFDIGNHTGKTVHNMVECENWPSYLGVLRFGPGGSSL
jgi:hypothetical protein